MREGKALCAGASHLQENRMERNTQYLLVTLEIARGKKSNSWDYWKVTLFGRGISPGLIMRNYELSLTTVLAGVSAGMGGAEGGKGY